MKRHVLESTPGYLERWHLRRRHDAADSRPASAGKLSPEGQRRAFAGSCRTVGEIPALSVEFRRARFALAVEYRAAVARRICQPPIRQLVAALSAAHHLRAVL